MRHFNGTVSSRAMKWLFMKTLSKNFAYFLMFNALLAILISIRYFEFLPEFPNDWQGISFLLTSVFSHMTLLTFVISLPLWLFIALPKRWFIALAAVYLSLYQGALFIDTLVFAQYKFHINPAILELITAGGMVDFPISTYILVALGILLFALFQAGAFIILSRPFAFKRHRPLKKLGVSACKRAGEPPITHLGIGVCLSIHY